MRSTAEIRKYERRLQASMARRLQDECPVIRCIAVKDRLRAEQYALQGSYHMGVGYAVSRRVERQLEECTTHLFEIIEESDMWVLSMERRYTGISGVFTSLDLALEAAHRWEKALAKARKQEFPTKRMWLKGNRHMLQGTAKLVLLNSMHGDTW